MMLKQRKITRFLASAAPVAVVPAALLCAAAPAYADTTVTSSVSTAYNTASAGNVTVASTGTVKVASGTAITVNSSNTATVNSSGVVNAGTATAAVDDVVGIEVNTGVSTTITNAGTIEILEDYTPTTVKSTVLYSAVSGVSGRYGILVDAGGTVTGTITNSGTIVVDGEDSGGIVVESTLNGSITNSGAISVLGDNSVGISLEAVTGNVTIGGTVVVTGSGSSGVVLNGTVGGEFVIDGSISNAYSYTDSDGTSLTLSRSQLNTGTAVVAVNSSVSGGIVINAPTSSTSSDQSRGSIVAYGDNTALQIGGTTNITIGSATTDNGTYSLGIDGSVSASAYYTSYDAHAIVIGGEGGNVTLTSGMEVYGTVSATTVDSSAYAIVISAGSTVTSLFNTGTIKAVASQEATGNIYAIQDLSGTLTSLTNEGYITVSGTTDGTSAAIDLSANTTGVTITQKNTSSNATLEADDKAASGYNPDSTTVYTAITGDIYTGSGNDTIDIETGNVTGNAYLGTGNNTVTLADNSKWFGNIDFGTSGTATLNMSGYSRLYGNLIMHDQVGTVTLTDSAKWLGTVTGGSQLTVDVTSGTFGASSAVTTTINTLNVGSGGTIMAYIDGSTGTSSELVANTATFVSGSKIGASISAIANAAGTYTVLSAGTLTGGSYITNSSLYLPALFKGSVSVSGNTVVMTIAQKTASDLGLNKAQTSAYSAIISDAEANTYIQKALLQIYDTPTLKGRFNEMLPDYSGGTFDFAQRGARQAAQHVEDDSTMFSISDTAAWLEPIIFHGTRRYGDTAGFKTSGSGLSMGFEKASDIGNVGLNLIWFSGNVKTGTYQTIKSGDYNLSAFWRKSSGALYTWIEAGLGRETFDSTRTFHGSITTSTTSSVTLSAFSYSAAGHWAGWSASGVAGASYNFKSGDHWQFRPKGMIDVFSLQENHHVETGDSPIALTVSSRTSNAATATGSLVASWSAGPTSHEGRPFTVELEAGRRQWLAGHLGNTTATFETGDAFTVNGGHLPSSFIGRLGIMQGGLDYTWRVGTDFERATDGGVSVGVRASISIAL